MKNIIQSLIFFLFITQLSSQCPVPTIIFPNGGELLVNDTEVVIEFEYGLDGIWEIHPVDFVYFYYSLDGGDTWILDTTIPINETELSSSQIIKHTWDISSIQSDKCLIKIQKYETGCWAESKAEFSIVPKPEILPADPRTLTIYPNPIILGNDLNVSVPQKMDQYFDLQIIDSYGQLVKHYPNEKTSKRISTENMIPGNYILVYRTKDEVKSKMFSIY